MAVPLLPVYCIHTIHMNQMVIASFQFHIICIWFNFTIVYVLHCNYTSINP